MWLRNGSCVGGEREESASVALVQLRDEGDKSLAARMKTLAAPRDLPRRTDSVTQWL